MSMTIGPPLTPPEAFAFLFCVVWPFVAMVLMRRGVRWRAFIASILAPLAVSSVVAWIELRRVLAVVDTPAVRDAAMGNALETFGMGIWSAAAVAVVALIQRRRSLRRLQT